MHIRPTTGFVLAGTLIGSAYGIYSLTTLPMPINEICKIIFEETQENSSEEFKNSFMFGCKSGFIGSNILQYAIKGIAAGVFGGIVNRILNNIGRGEYGIEGIILNF